MTGDTGLADSGQGLGVGLHALQTQGLVVCDLHLVAACHRLGGINELLVEADDVLPLGQGGVHNAGQGVDTHLHEVLEEQADDVEGKEEHQTHDAINAGMAVYLPVRNLSMRLERSCSLLSWGLTTVWPPAPE